MMSENRIGYTPPYTACTGTADNTGTLAPGAQTLFISKRIDRNDRNDRNTIGLLYIRNNNH